MFSIFLLDKFSLTSQSSLGRVFSMYHHSPKFFWLCHPNLRQWKSDCSVCTCICCSAYHGRFLHFLWFIVNIKGGSLLVESVLKIPDSPQDEPNHPCCCFPWQRCVSSFSFMGFPRLIGMFQAVWGGGEEAQVVFRQHLGHDLNPADCFRLLHLLSNHCHLHRQEEENHLLGGDGTRRSGSAVHLQERGWRNICARRDKLEGEREEGGKVPPLLDHHHLHLHLHLLHNHLHRVKRTMHTSWSRPLLIDLNLSISSIFCYELFVWLMWFCYVSFLFMCYPWTAQIYACQTNKETQSFN